MNIIKKVWNRYRYHNDRYVHLIPPSKVLQHINNKQQSFYFNNDVYNQSIKKDKKNKEDIEKLYYFNLMGGWTEMWNSLWALLT